MNNEIKFRFWGDFGTIEEDDGKERNMMLYGDEFAFDSYEPIDYLFGKLHRTKAMQYTGLKDKNEKKVYEGDIIKIDSTKIGKLKGEVIFNTDKTLPFFGWGLLANGGYYEIDFLGDIEIIGNIYENPELLEVVDNG